MSPHRPLPSVPQLPALTRLSAMVAAVHGDTRTGLTGHAALSIELLPGRLQGACVCLRGRWGVKQSGARPGARQGEVLNGVEQQVLGPSPVCADWNSSARLALPTDAERQVTPARRLFGADQPGPAGAPDAAGYPALPVTPICLPACLPQLTGHEELCLDEASSSLNSDQALASVNKRGSR